MKNKQSVFWLFTISVFTALLLPVLVHDGMFLDGLIYASLSRNMAMGEGSFWMPRWGSQTFDNPFYGHPPLVLWLQALFFKIFGDHLFVERVYSFFTAIITGLFIVKIWKYTFRQDPTLSSMGWLPVLFWIITPVVFWSYSNNMLENTMSIFDLAAILIILKSFDSQTKIFLRLFLISLIILLAFFSKGPVGLFPLAAPFFYWYFFPKVSFPKITFAFITIILILLITIFLIILFVPYALNYFEQYFGDQLLHSLQGKKEMAPYRFYIIKRLISELIPIILISMIIFFSSGKKWIALSSNNKKLVFFFLAVGFSASIPIVISPKQSGFYLVPSFPYYALAAGIFIAPTVNSLILKINMESRGFRFFKIFLFTLFFGIIIFSFLQIGKIKRDKDDIQVVYEIGKIIPSHSAISLCPDLYENWVLHTYMWRYNRIRLNDGNENEFYLTTKNCKEKINENYSKIVIRSNTYELYKRK